VAFLVGFIQMPNFIALIQFEFLPVVAIIVDCWLTVANACEYHRDTTEAVW